MMLIWRMGIWLKWLDFKHPKAMVFLSFSSVMCGFLLQNLLSGSHRNNRTHRWSTVKDNSTAVVTYSYIHACNDDYSQPSPVALRTNILALFTKARMSSSNAFRSCSEAFGSPRLAAVARRRAGRLISSSSSWKISGCRCMGC